MEEGVVGESRESGSPIPAGSGILSAGRYGVDCLDARQVIEFPYGLQNDAQEGLT